MGRLNDLTTVMNEPDVHEDLLCISVAGKTETEASALVRVKHTHK
jgi:hypothetical protein